MRRVLPVVAVMVALLYALPGFATPAKGKRFYFGGGIGLGFGTVDFVDVSPLVGYRVTQEFSVGARVTWRYRSDYRIAQPLYLQAEYEYLSYEFVRSDGTSDRDEFDSVFGGFGFVQPMGGRSSFFVTALYNFSFSSDDRGPYSDPWVVRAGVAFGF